jgi:hypothetical protein
VAKPSPGMHKSGGTKNRGRTAGASHLLGPNPSKPNVPQTLRREASRPIGNGVKHRGDRRDTNRVFTNNDQRQPNFSNPAGSGRGQTQGGGKARTGGGKRQKGTYDH